MPTCPQCKTEQTKRKNDACPNCGTEVSVYAGMWFRTELGSPTAALVEHFEDLVSKRQSAKVKANVIFRIPRKSSTFRRELRGAEALLELAEWDFELARDALTHLFENTEYSWKSWTTLLYLKNEFILALGVVKALKEEREKKEAHSNSIFDQIMAQEDLFS